MSELSVTKITDRVGTGKVNLSQGFKVAGTLDTTLAPTRTEGNTEPATPVNGDTWYDTDNDTYDVYINDEWKRFLGEAATSGWIADVASFSSSTEEFSIASQETTPRDVTFNADGTKMYIVGQSADSILQYSLSTAFNVSTASYDSVSYNPIGTNLHGLRFNSDGTKFYVLSTPNLYQHSMSTPYNIATASYDNVAFDFNATGGQPYAFDISPDGTKLIVVNFSLDVVYQYTMSTGFDLSTLSYDSISLSVSGNSTNPFGISWSTNGGAMYINDNTSGEILQYLCSTAFDISTATYDDTFNYSSGILYGQGLAFSSDGSKLFMTATGTDKVHTILTGL